MLFDSLIKEKGDLVLASQDKWLGATVFGARCTRDTRLSHRYSVGLGLKGENGEEHIVRPIFLLQLSENLYTIHKPVLLHLTSPSYLIVTLVFVCQ